METSPQTEKERTLLKKYLAGNCSAAEKEQVELWYKSFDQSPLPGRTQEKNSLNNVKRKLFNQIQSANPKKARIFRLPVYLRFAAVLALMTTISLMIYRFSDHAGQTAIEYVTLKGEHKVITLADGSVVTLNSGSSLKVKSDFKQSTREVQLSGEAFFKIAKDKSRPFIIQSGNLKTTVLGTSFNINAYPDLSEIKIAVATGKVKVAHTTENKQELMLANEMVKDQVLIFNSKTQLAEIKTGNTELLSSWISNKLYIDNSSMDDIAKQLSRHYNTKVSLDPKMNDTDKYTITLGNENLQTSAQILSEFTHHTFYIKQNQLYIMKKK
ncbi:FecR family protein [Pedobacter metabolipauper]|uniref:FecR family protein n=1 Tax=Pedobacter metabolipauper TaxID=425513 RepID=A0A4R6SUN3_9SPHI|nr:FecR family protein [Pedobacter metabolipauper]TDQ09450.1 FecR family protein [Pedobacter metabolipauper]